MVSVKIHKGFTLRLKGAPSEKLAELETPSHVASLPDKIPFIKPRLLVETGDRVKTGTALFEDKKNPGFKFLSPGSGEIAAINRGPRRVIQEIIIQQDGDELYEEFEQLTENEAEKIGREKLAALLMTGGLWPLIRELPFRNIADPAYIPPMIWVSLESKEPFQPAPEIYTRKMEGLFDFGIRILRRLSGKVHVTASSDNTLLSEEINKLITHRFRGNYPADDSGSLLYHTKKTPSENRCWFISGQDVLLIAELFKTGRYPTRRVVAIGGSGAKEPRHVITRIGVPVSHIAPDISDSDRCVAGGLFKGYPVSQKSFIGFYETSLTVIPEHPASGLFGFMSPGIRKPSYSKTFLSALVSSPLDVDSGAHGEKRACINCGTCATVCAVDILPQFMYKSLKADEIEEALGHGLLDCVECGLCSYVCPSKIELCEQFKAAKGVYYKEQY